MNAISSLISTIISFFHVIISVVLGAILVVLAIVVGLALFAIFVAFVAVIFACAVVVKLLPLIISILVVILIAMAVAGTTVSLSWLSAVIGSIAIMGLIGSIAIAYADENADIDSLETIRARIRDKYKAQKKQYATFTQAQKSEIDALTKELFAVLETLPEEEDYDPSCPILKRCTALRKNLDAKYIAFTFANKWTCDKTSRASAAFAAA